MAGLFHKLSIHPHKHLLLRCAAAVIALVFSLTAMAFTAYAYFATTIRSTFTLNTAVFTAGVSIVPADSQGSYTLTQQDSHTHKAQLQPGQYTVTLTTGDGCTATTGYCRVMLGATPYCTEQLFLNAGDGITAITFTLKLSQVTDLTVSDRWGTCSHNAQPHTEMQILVNGAVLELPAVTGENEAPDETPTETATEAPTEAATEAPTEAATEAPTEAATEAPTEAATEAQANEDTGEE